VGAGVGHPEEVAHRHRGRAVHPLSGGQPGLAGERLAQRARRWPEPGDGRVGVVDLQQPPAAVGDREQYARGRLLAEGGRLPPRPAGGLSGDLGGGELADDPAQAPWVQERATIAEFAAQPGLQVAGQVEQLGEGAFRFAARAQDVGTERQPGQHLHQVVGGAPCQGGPGDRGQVGLAERQAERAGGDAELVPSVAGEGGQLGAVGRRRGGRAGSRGCGRTG
jgi:hypothetical protein